MGESQMSEGVPFEVRLHHIGFVVRNIESQIAGFTSSILATSSSKIFHDPLQKVRVVFLRPPDLTGPLIELVEPATDDSPVERFLKRGGGLHHLCYEVRELDGHLHKMRARGAVIVKPPHPAVAFENRLIAWVMTKEKLLLEFLEK
jgi:methylmalonyl-CoA/ethylmalonyl-CoA epimerase